MRCGFWRQGSVESRPLRHAGEIRCALFLPTLLASQGPRGRTHSVQTVATKSFWASRFREESLLFQPRSSFLNAVFPRYTISPSPVRVL